MIYCRREITLLRGKVGHRQVEGFAALAHGIEQDLRSWAKRAVESFTPASTQQTHKWPESSLTPGGVITSAGVRSGVMDCVIG